MKRTIFAIQPQKTSVEIQREINKEELEKLEHISDLWGHCPLDEPEAQWFNIELDQRHKQMDDHRTAPLAAKFNSRSAQKLPKSPSSSARFEERDADQLILDFGMSPEKCGDLQKFLGAQRKEFLIQERVNETNAIRKSLERDV
jgi:hypothetical protein